MNKYDALRDSLTQRLVGKKLVTIAVDGESIKLAFDGGEALSIELCQAELYDDEFCPASLLVDGITHLPH